MTDTNRFWQLIDATNPQKDRANWREDNSEAHIENLTQALRGKDKGELIAFETWLQETLAAIHSGASVVLYIILNNDYHTENGQYRFDDYLSADGYLYFRCWLILKGKAFCDDIRHDLNRFNSGKYSFDLAEPWAEGLLYVSDDAHGDEDDSIRDAVYDARPEIHYDNGLPDIPDWPDANDLVAKYPELVQSIVALRQ